MRAGGADYGMVLLPMCDAQSLICADMTTNFGEVRAKNGK